jgi:hypothetical protein
VRVTEDKIEAEGGGDSINNSCANVAAHNTSLLCGGTNQQLLTNKNRTCAVHRFVQNHGARQGAGVVDKLWNYVFQPTPINPDKETSQLQPTKYDDFGDVIPPTVGPQNTITNPNSTFGEPQTAAPSTETPWWESAWNGTKEIASNTWGAITKEFGFETQAAPEQVASEEKSGSQASGFAESAALRDEKSRTDENAQIPGDQIAEVKKGPAETTRDLALNSGPTEDMSTDQSTSRTAEEIKKDALRPTATGIMTGYNPEKPGERSGGRGLATGGTYDPNAWEVAIRTDIGKSTGCGVGGGSICYALIESPDGKAAIVRVPDNGPLSGQGISTSEYRVVDLNQKVGEYFSGSTDVNNIKLQNMKVTLLSGNDYQVGPIVGNTGGIASCAGNSKFTFDTGLQNPASNCRWSLPQSQYGRESIHSIIWPLTTILTRQCCRVGRSRAQQP